MVRDGRVPISPRDVLRVVDCYLIFSTNIVNVLSCFMVLAPRLKKRLVVASDSLIMPGDVNLRPRKLFLSPWPFSLR